MMEVDGASRQSFKKAVEGWNSEIKNFHGQKIGHRNIAHYGQYTQVYDMAREKSVERYIHIMLEGEDGRMKSD